jgi:hypothetical protein
MNDCPICLQEINAETCVTTSCNHVFYQLCIDSWLSKKNTCPCCRNSIINIDYDDTDYDDMPPLIAIDYDDMPPLTEINNIYIYENQLEHGEYFTNHVITNNIFREVVIHNDIFRGVIINNNNITELDDEITE